MNASEHRPPSSAVRPMPPGRPGTAVATARPDRTEPLIRRGVARRSFHSDWSLALDGFLEQQIRHALMSNDESPAAARQLRQLLLESHAAHIGALSQRAELRDVLNRVFYRIAGLTFVHTAGADMPITNQLAGAVDHADRTPAPDAALLHVFRHLLRRADGS